MRNPIHLPEGGDEFFQCLKFVQTFVSIGSTHPNPNPLSHLPLPHPCARAAALRSSCRRRARPPRLPRRRDAPPRALPWACRRSRGRPRSRCAPPLRLGHHGGGASHCHCHGAGGDHRPEHHRTHDLSASPAAPPALLPGRMPRGPPATAQRDTKHKPESVSARAITPWYWRASTAPAGHWTSSPEKKAIVPSSPEKKAPAHKEKRHVQLSILVLSTFCASNFNILF